MQQSPPWKWPPGFRVRLLAWMRLLAMLLGLQLSGMGHALADAIAVVVSGTIDHGDECPIDRPCDECPPGCPNCHCPNTLRAAEPGTPVAIVGELRPFLVNLVAYDTAASPDPERSSVYRPPRGSSAG